MTATWRKGGANVKLVGRKDSSQNRAVAVDVQAKEQKRALYLVAAYAPMSRTNAHLDQDRDKF